VNLKEYQEITGKTIAESDKKSVTAQIRRSQLSLESMLGFTLDPSKINENLYNEVGKTRNELSYPNVDILNLLPADEVIGAYRLYRYNPNDKFLFVDPFTAVHSVKLVHIRVGYPDESSVTFKTFDPNEVRAQYGRDGIGKYIEKNSFYRCYFEQDFVQLAVDADWAFQDCLPMELKLLLADMVSARLDPYNNIKSESIEGHSYSKFDRIAPETEAHNLAIIRRYAGPYGTASGNTAV
jgi:hypothetical protein